MKENNHLFDDREPGAIDSSVTWLIVELKFIVFVKLVNCGQEFLLNPTFE